MSKDLAKSTGVEHWKQEVMKARSNEEIAAIFGTLKELADDYESELIKIIKKIKFEEAKNIKQTVEEVRFKFLRQDEGFRKDFVDHLKTCRNRKKGDRSREGIIEIMARYFIKKAKLKGIFENGIFVESNTEKIIDQLNAIFDKMTQKIQEGVDQAKEMEDVEDVRGVKITILEQIIRIAIKETMKNGDQKKLG